LPCWPYVILVNAKRPTTSAFALKKVIFVATQTTPIRRNC
jgi:predicted ATP-grasp superfamily ATP-dependent carboligase